jgi:hypothetical protein
MLSIVHIDCFGAGRKIHCGLSLFLECIGARLFESAEGSVEGETRGWLVNLDYTRIDLIRERKSFLQINRCILADHPPQSRRPCLIKYYFSNGSVNPPLSEFEWISGIRWPSKTMFEAAICEVTFDHYKMRSWLVLHHRILLVSLAYYFLVRLRIRIQQLAPALRFYQVRLLRASDIPTPVCDVSAA